MEIRGVRGMTVVASDGLPEWGHVRRVAFYVWAVILSLLSGILFAGVTILTIGLWLVNQNPYTTPVTDLGFFALGAIIITTGFVVQLRAPERKIAGVQQAVIGLLALGVAGLIGGRVEPLTGSLLFLVATAILVALHPARREFFKVGAHLSPRLAALSILAAIPASAYATTMLIQARQAGPSCSFGRCAYGDRFAELAALAMAVVIAGMLAASSPGGWRVTAWSVGAAAATLGSVSIVLPELAGALGQGGGAMTLAWGVLFIAVAEWEYRWAGSPGDVGR
ncbi:MAG TPA: hypothetical protein VF177_02850 [Anaerolineae bacterium]